MALMNWAIDVLQKLLQSDAIPTQIYDSSLDGFINQFYSAKDNVDQKFKQNKSGNKEELIIKESYQILNCNGLSSEIRWHEEGISSNR